MALLKEQRLSPIIKWPGGKERELHYIHPCLPATVKNYYEPFVGGGAVYFSLNADTMYINDKSHELISVYKAIACQDDIFFTTSAAMARNWLLLQGIVHTHRVAFVKKYTHYSKDVLSDADIQKWIAAFVLKHQSEFSGLFDSIFAGTGENFLHEIQKNIARKMQRMKNIEKKRGTLPQKDIVDNMESALKSAFYMHVRYLYNASTIRTNTDSVTAALFFFIRNYAYSGMFRYSKKKGFNVPYGGIAYNRKNLTNKLAYLQTAPLTQHLLKTTITSMDFEDFFAAHPPAPDDFIFLDPPYDSEFSTYAKNAFTKHDQVRLASYLLHRCKARWMLIIKNTDFIHELYDTANVYMRSFRKKYVVSFQNRNNKDAEHLLITNYITSSSA